MGEITNNDTVITGTGGKPRPVMNSYLTSRYAKLKAQGEKAENGILAGVKA